MTTEPPMPGGAPSDQLTTAAAEPYTLKDRLAGLLMAAAAFGLAAWMWFHPVLF